MGHHPRSCSQKQVFLVTEGQWDPLKATTYCGQMLHPSGQVPPEVPRATLGDLANFFGRYTEGDFAQLTLLAYANDVLSPGYTGQQITTMAQLIKAYNTWRGGLKSKLNDELHRKRVQQTKDWPATLRAWQEAERERLANEIISFEWGDYAHFHGEWPQYC